MDFFIRKAQSEDMTFIKKCIKKFRLDDENLDYRQFIVAVKGSDIVGFGRIRPHKEVYPVRKETTIGGKKKGLSLEFSNGVFELGCVGVVESRRKQGIGKMIVEHLINIFPSNEVYITTDLIKYFERFGFKRIESGPKELVEKLKRVCVSKCREGAVVMVYKKGK